MRSRRSLAAAVLALALAGGTSAGAETLSLDDYRARLAGVLGALDAGDLAQLRERAGALRDARVVTAAGDTATDSSILAPLSAAATLDEAREHRVALAGLVESLGAAADQEAPDAGLLARLREEQALEELEQGQLAELPLPELSLSERALRALETAAHWIGARLRDLLELAMRLLGAGRHGAPIADTRTVLAAIGALAAGLLLGVLVVLLRARFRRKASPAPGAPGTAAPEDEARDADPLSRDVREWIERAEELAAAGRTREALRAWYHAVLAALREARLLEPRRGRTNWEHVAGLPPRLAWRTQLVELTRAFDREWYGLNRTSPETLHEFSRAAHALVTAATRERPA